MLLRLSQQRKKKKRGKSASGSSALPELTAGPKRSRSLRIRLGILFMIASIVGAVGFYQWSQNEILIINNSMRQIKMFHMNVGHHSYTLQEIAPQETRTVALPRGASGGIAITADLDDGSLLECKFGHVGGYFHQRATIKLRPDGTLIGTQP
jgi:hypothetical protein